MAKIIKVLTGDEWTYLKKNFFGWKVVYPIKTEAGNINWKHLISGGTWWNLVFVGAITLLAVLVVNEYVSNITYLQQQLAQCNINFFP